MAEYIEREALQEIFENRMQDNNIMCPVIKVLDVIEIIEKAPTADVVEVVRCKDCRFFSIDYTGGNWTCLCGNGLYRPEPATFCSYGERNDGGTEK